MIRLLIVNNKILSIHYLRGIAALLVVFFHFSIYLDGVYVQKDLGWILFGSGAFGVDLFFMISGFVIVLSTQKKSSTSVFLVRRFFRVYPIFIFVFIIGALTVYSKESSTDLLKAALLIHKDYSKPSPTFGYNILGTAWTLSYEVYFYLVFSIAMTISDRYKVIISSAMLLIPVISLQLFFTGTFSFSGSASPQIAIDTPIYGLIRFMASPILIEFVIGMLFFEVFSKTKFKLNAPAATFVFALCCGIFLTFYFSQFNNEFGLHGFGLWAIFLLFGSLTYDKSIGFKENKALIFLGDISYSLYISHYVFVNAVAYYTPSFMNELTGIGKFILMATATISTGVAIHYAIEKPSINLGKRLESSLKKLALQNTISLI